MKPQIIISEDDYKFLLSAKRHFQELKENAELKTFQAIRTYGCEGNIALLSEGELHEEYVKTIQEWQIRYNRDMFWKKEETKRNWLKRLFNI